MGIAYNNGCGYIEGEKKLIFTEIASELEEKIEDQSKAINNYTTQAISISGEYAAIAISNLTNTVAHTTHNLVQSIALSKNVCQF